MVRPRPLNPASVQESRADLTPFSAGADLVMSYASMAANAILNFLKPDELLMLAEGLNIFRVVTPTSYADKSLAETQIRSQTGCNVVAICDRETACINPEPAYRLHQNDELILIGSEGAIGRFFKMHPDSKRIKV